MIDSEVVHRRYFGSPRPGGGLDFRNLLSDLTERTLLDRNRDRERQHVRGEAHPLFRVMTPEEISNESNNPSAPLVLRFICIYFETIFISFFLKH